MESSLSRFEEQCTTVFNTCQDRRPKKGFSLFVCFCSLLTHLQNKKEQSGTDVPPPIWVHPDYIFNADAMITQMKQIRDISEAGMHSRLHDASFVCSNQHHAQQSTPQYFPSFIFLYFLFFSFILLLFSFSSRSFSVCFYASNSDTDRDWDCDCDGSSSASVPCVSSLSRLSFPSLCISSTLRSVEIIPGPLIPSSTHSRNLACCSGESTLRIPFICSCIDSMLSFIFFCTLSTMSRIDEIFSCCRSNPPRLPTIRFFCSSDSYASAPNTQRHMHHRRQQIPDASAVLHLVQLLVVELVLLPHRPQTHLRHLHIRLPISRPLFLPASAAAASSAAPDTAGTLRFAPVRTRSTSDNTL